MKVVVGLINHGVTTKAVLHEDGTVTPGKFIADTLTIFLSENDEETRNMHEGNYNAVALAIARRRAGVGVFPIDIAKPEWPLLSAKEYRDAHDAGIYAGRKVNKHFARADRQVAA